MAAHVANRKAELEVNMLVRDPQVCLSINDNLLSTFVATTDAKSTLLGVDSCLHAVPVQCIFSRECCRVYVDPGLPFISMSKGLELNTLRMMAQIIPQALRNPRQPFVALSRPSFSLELMDKLPTGNWDELEEELSCQEVGTHKGHKEHQKRRLQKVALTLGCPFHDPQRWNLVVTLGRPFWGAERHLSCNVSRLSALHWTLSANPLASTPERPKDARDCGLVIKDRLSSPRDRVLSNLESDVNN
ncbi:hypothetical protein LR48_Vigan02g071800 [Vigna angularis]|uniref:Glycerol-3-phosphate dehydrogenase NAD-dependent N-terminal domain-containing protein n=1 Tax=Phaseolus angularis TaxID=3914 RepID=A0A0L9TVF0_PHAAN|nr:hypothetical protein LR48_Vigan02g071800 [Vigna angularis]